MCFLVIIRCVNIPVVRLANAKKTRNAVITYKSQLENKQESRLHAYMNITSTLFYFLFNMKGKRFILNMIFLGQQY